MTLCTCNNYNEIASGGIAAGGSAAIELVEGLSITASGGAVAGGSALVDTNHAFDDVTGFWFLDETGDGSADEYIDQSPNGFHGQGGNGFLTQTPIDVSGLNCLNAQYFDGTNDFITLPQDNLSSVQPFSVSLWVKHQVKYKQRVYYSRGIETPSTGWVFCFGFSKLNHLWSRLQMSDGTVHYCFSSATLHIDRWYHVAATWHPSNGLSVYIDGVLAGSNTDATGTTATLSNGGYIGRFNNGGFPDVVMQFLKVLPHEKDADWFSVEKASICGGLYSYGNSQSPIHY